MSTERVEQAAPDQGSVYQVAVCTHCSRDIVLMPGDNLWVHDSTGWQRCDGLPDSTPKERNGHLSLVQTRDSRPARSAVRSADS